MADGFPAPARRPPLGADSLGYDEGRLSPAEALPRACDLGGAERRAMRRGGAGLGRRAKGDRRPAGDQARAVALMGATDGVRDRLVVMAVDPFRGPAMRAEPHDLVVGNGEIGGAVDRNRIVVPEHDKLAEAEMTGERQRLVADAFHQAPVPDE